MKINFIADKFSTLDINATHVKSIRSKGGDSNVCIVMVITFAKNAMITM
jgi:hypothetical protein